MRSRSMSFRRAHAFSREPLVGVASSAVSWHSRCRMFARSGAARLRAVTALAGVQDQVRDEVVEPAHINAFAELDLDMARTCPHLELRVQIEGARVL